MVKEKKKTTKKTTKKSPLKKRARKANGTYISDDPGTPENEAYVQPPVSNNKKYLGILIGLVLLALLFLSQG